MLGVIPEPKVRAMDDSYDFYRASYTDLLRTLSQVDPKTVSYRDLKSLGSGMIDLSRTAIQNEGAHLAAECAELNSFFEGLEEWQQVRFVPVTNYGACTGDLSVFRRRGVNDRPGPPWKRHERSLLPGGLPRHLRRLLEKCAARDAIRRFREIASRAEHIQFLHSMIDLIEYGLQRSDRFVHQLLNGQPGYKPDSAIAKL